jgi:hypothetical protein
VDPVVRATDAADYIKNLPPQSKEAVIEMVTENGLALQHAAEELKGDKEVVMEAVKQNGKMLHFALGNLKGDISIVFEAMNQNGPASVSAAEVLKKHERFLRQLINSLLYACCLSSKSFLIDEKIKIRQMITAKVKNRCIYAGKAIKCKTTNNKLTKTAEYILEI